MLRSAIGEAAANHLHELSWGRDPRAVDPAQAEKSVGAEVTFDTDLADPVAVRRTLLGLAGRAAARLRATGQAGRTVAIKVRFADFHTVTRSRSLAYPTDVSREVFAIAWELFQAMGPGDPIRLVGVRVEGLFHSGTSARQPALGEPEHGWRDAEAAVDVATARFGPAAVRPASLLGPAGPGGAPRGARDPIPGHDPPGR
jgi:DNA polymerase-4